MSKRRELLHGEMIGDAALASAEASRALLNAALTETELIEPWVDDFAESELDMKGILSLMRQDGPEVKGRRVINTGGKSTKVVSSPEAIIATTKAAELFILDLALKTWQAKEFETDEKKRISTELNLEDIKKAVRMNEHFDFLEMIPSPGESNTGSK
jgi:hypothetical protein